MRAQVNYELSSDSEEMVLAESILVDYDSSYEILSSRSYHDESSLSSSQGVQQGILVSAL